MLWALDLAVTASPEWHRHDVVEFGLCLEGAGRLCGDAGDLDLAPGVSFLVPPGAWHRFAVAEGAELRLKLICLVPADLDRHLPPALVERVRAETTISAGRGDVARLAAIADLIRDGLRVTDRGGGGVDWAAVGLLVSLHLERAGSVAVAPRPEDARMRAVADWLDAHLDAPLSLDDLATRFGLSRSLLTRAFRRFTGLSLVEYRNRRRLERAALMLAEAEMSVTAIGFAVGFGNASHFHHQFKTLFGVAPAAFRRTVRDDGGAALGRTGTGARPAGGDRAERIA
jgi:AraC family transcriptional activator of mar-sox-rob regulon